ncbi:restriction endonuclease subunit S [Bacillus nitratireducens]|uniref:restriction endonuclease subunit S n=1 Tax=Bacillus nitratireducens TaxID=2026193 RepID=UPI001155F3C2|nr:restriction endonuclease subunit S [Bacillus nitratireducens]
MSKKKKDLDTLIQEAIVRVEDQPTSLPENWIWSKLDYLTDSAPYSLVDGPFGSNLKTVDYKTEGVRLIQLQNIGDGYWKDQNQKFISEEKAKELERCITYPDDIVIAKMAAPIARATIVPKIEEKYIVVADCIKLTIDKKLNIKYLVHCINSPIVRQVAESLGKGSTRKRINLKDVKKLPIPLPPLHEQKRIAEKVEYLLNKIEEAKRLIEEAIETFELRRAAILEKAFNGELTSSWRENNLYYAQKEFEQFHAERKLQVSSKQELKKYSFSNYSIENDLKSNGEFPDNWIELPVGFICECIVPGRDKPKSFSGDIPWITIPDITSETVYTSKSGLGLTEAEIKQVKAKVIPCNSIIMTCIGRFGISSVVQNPVVINQQLHAFLPNKIIDPKFLMYQIRTLEKYMQGIATSTTIAYLNKKNANSLPIKLPPIEEQKEIVIQLEKLLVKEESIFKMLPSKNDLEELKQSILSKAFKGELGTKDTNDKPAMELLKSILQEKL